MPYYLGITLGWMHDSAACLIEDNKIITLAEEERFTRRKHDGSQPINAIKFCLKKAGINLSDVEKVGVSTEMNLPRYIKRTPGKPLPTFLNYLDGLRNLRTLKNSLRKEFGHDPEVVQIDHHITHIYSSFPFSGFKKSLCISADGGGDRLSTVIYSSTGEILKTFNVYNSLGLFYGRITEWLGFKFADGEGKTMGLAPYGS